MSGTRSGGKGGTVTICSPRLPDVQPGFQNDFRRRLQGSRVSCKSEPFHLVLCYREERLSRFGLSRISPQVLPVWNLSILLFVFPGLRQTYWDFMDIRICLWGSGNSYEIQVEKGKGNSLFPSLLSKRTGRVPSIISFALKMARKLQKLFSLFLAMPPLAHCVVDSA